MANAKRNPVPSSQKVQDVIRKGRKLLRDEPDNPSSGYRRGLVYSLRWVLGENPEFEELLLKVQKEDAPCRRKR